MNLRGLNLNFQVKQGEVFGLLGPNGAGKTTFLSILGGTVSKTKGIVNVWGFDIDKNPRQVKSSIGIVPQEVNLDAFFSPKKLLELQAGLYGITKKDRITDLILKMVALENKANSFYRLSGDNLRLLPGHRGTVECKTGNTTIHLYDAKKLGTILSSERTNHSP